MGESVCPLWRVRTRCRIFLLPLPFLFFLFTAANAATASFDLEKALSLNCSPHCYSGACVQGACVCTPGWKGAQCDICQGRTRLTDTNSLILDSPLSYGASSNCAWLVDNNTESLTLRVANFTTECGWDYLYVYDGDGTDGEQLAALCGTIESFEMTLPSKKAFVVFFSDQAEHSDGFLIRVEKNRCAYDCNNNGACNDGRCQCDAGYAGTYCEHRYCLPDETDSGPCQMQSKCNNGKCDCLPGYHGEFCQAPNSQGAWQSERNGPDPTTTHAGRASHASVLRDNKIWTVGGDRFDNAKNFNEVEVFDVDEKTWTGMKTTGTPPGVRYDHSLVSYKDKIYMFGGVIDKRRQTSELWSLDVNTLQWTLETAHNDELLVAPVSVYGHTAHVIGQQMYVFFGYNNYLKFTYFVQKYDFATKEWSIVESPEKIQGRYRHSSVYYEAQNVVLVYGGMLSVNDSAQATDSLYRFSVKESSWMVLQSSGHPSYMQSATILNGHMIVSGGNGYTKNLPTQCFTGAVLQYDIPSCKWLTTRTEPLLRRYGHTLVSNDSFAWAVGGFNGSMLGDVIKFIPAQCSSVSKQDDCLALDDGVSCVFSGGNCVLRDQTRSYPQTFLSVAKGEQLKADIDCPSGQRGLIDPCEQLKDCVSCATHGSCGWCVAGNQCLPHDAECVDGEEIINSYTKCSSDLAHRTSSLRSCSSALDCFNCKILKHCNWFGIDSRNSCVSLAKQAEVQSSAASEEAKRLAGATVPVKISPTFPTGLPLGQNTSDCPTPCPDWSTCSDCVTNNCMWCGSQKRCVYNDSYFISFPYGQCNQWTTNAGTPVENDFCEETGSCQDRKNCSTCQLDPKCGWMDDGNGMGLGKCVPGSAKGPKDTSITGQWFFVGCPECQCNGHSDCQPSKSSIFGQQVCRKCENNTMGDHCETCGPGYFGDPRNGGICQPCQCVGHANGCNPDTGACYCTTKGVVGTHCDRCDNKYHGDPATGNCYYELTVDFIFTFNLKSDPPDHYVSEIYLFSIPYKRDTDVTFQISCDQSAASVSLNLTSNIFEGRPSNPKMKMVNVACESKGLRRYFLANDPGYAFGTDANTTFFVKVSNFTTPIKIQVSFAQSPPINWVLFFVIFAICFIVLLVLAGLLWMVKLRIDAYRASTDRINAIVQMAQRPFQKVQLDLSGPNGTPLSVHHPSMATPIAIEPRSNYRSGIFTLAVRLPTGGRATTPSSTSGLALASALCVLSQSQEATLRSSEDSENRPKPKTNLRRFFPFYSRSAQN